MSEAMVERAARAMYDNVSPDWSWEDPDAELLRQMYRENVRVTLTALRTPSRAMLEAGHGLEAHAAYRAMIDAAFDA